MEWISREKLEPNKQDERPILVFDPDRKQPTVVWWDDYAQHWTNVYGGAPKFRHWARITDPEAH